jgi:hypothetical protein
LQDEIKREGEEENVQQEDAEDDHQPEIGGREALDRRVAEHEEAEPAHLDTNEEVEEDGGQERCVSQKQKTDKSALKSVEREMTTERQTKRGPKTAEAETTSTSGTGGRRTT